MTVAPLKLSDNRPPVYYAGGANISRFRGNGSAATGPEDWVASLCILPEGIRPPDAPADCGVSHTADGQSLRDIVDADIEAWLGRELSTRYRGDTGLLVKLLDSGERLPVHCHPSREFARRHLGSIFGKTEGWVIMSADEGARVWVGMRDHVDRAQLRSWIDGQEVDAMLAAMNEIAVKAGDVVYVPSGVPHSIGPGVMLTELQEPTSFSVLADHDGFGVADEAATLGLGWDLAVSCFDLSAYGDRLDSLLPPPTLLDHTSGATVHRLFPTQADEFFRGLRVSSNGDAVSLGAVGFAVVVVVDGSGELTWEGGRVPVARGETLVMPADVGALEAIGTVRMLVCLPPAP